MSSAAPSPSLRNLFSELEQLFQTETEARVSVSVHAAEQALAERLNQAVRRLRQSTGFAEMAAILCDASQSFAGICAVFHVNESIVGGERVRGVAAEAAARFSDLRFPAAEGASFAAIIESQEPVVALYTPVEVSSALFDLFGPVSGDKVHLFPLAVDRTVIGVLLAIGAVENAPLELLAQAGAAVLEARQRPLRRDLVMIEPASTPPAGRAPDWDELSTADRQLHLRAQRFARVQVAEMRLYRPDAVKNGRARGDLYSALQDAIDEGRKTYGETFISATPTMVDYFHRELLRTLANDNPAWLGEKYPGPLV